MFVAYLLPKPTDVFNLLEDGLQWIAKGDTKAWAECNLRGVFEEQMYRDFYTEQEIEAIWNQHDLYIAEV